MFRILLSLILLISSSSLLAMEEERNPPFYAKFKLNKQLINAVNSLDQVETENLLKRGANPNLKIRPSCIQFLRQGINSEKIYHV